MLTEKSTDLEFFQQCSVMVTNQVLSLHWVLRNRTKECSHAFHGKYHILRDKIAVPIRMANVLYLESTFQQTEILISGSAVVRPTQVIEYLFFLLKNTDDTQS